MPSVQMRAHRLNSSVAILFAVGSTCFAVGSVPVYANAVGSAADLVTFFVGSLFFTSASFGQLVQSQTPGSAPTEGSGRDSVRLRFAAWLPHDRNWLAAATQFPGTLAFNVTTFAALATGLSVAEEDRKVWRPDFVGSVLFLVASTFAILALTTDRRWWAPREWVWWNAWLNMTGSLAFMASAIASYVLPATGNFVSVAWSDGGTLVGAVCFLVGALLMLPAWNASQRRS